MPRLSIWFIRSSLAYLTLGFTFGGLLLVNKAFPYFPYFWILLPSHIEFVLFGWMVQLVMGMAFWILPRFPKPPIRGNEKLAWGAFALVNAGIWFIALASFWPGSQWLFFTGRVVETAGVLAFVAHAWPRVKGVGIT
jgi:hypothetical protein